MIVRYGFPPGELIDCPGLVPREGSISQAEFDELLEPLKHIQVPPCPSEEAFVCDGALYGFEVVLGSTRFSYQWHTISPKGLSRPFRDDMPSFAPQFARNACEDYNGEKMDTQFSLAVCFPVWNRADLFLACYNSLLRQLEGLETSIWVFDNGSDAPTRALIGSLNSRSHRLFKVSRPENTRLSCKQRTEE